MATKKPKTSDTGQTPLKGNDLKALGYTEGKILGFALELANKADWADGRKATVLAELRKTRKQPELYTDHAVLGPLAQAILAEKAEREAQATLPLHEEKRPYAIFGADQIEDGARQQMDVAMQLPITVAGALMPDAHQGYGLPIGGVLAVDNAVIPFGVGVDIGCRMALTVFDMPADFFFEHTSQFKRELIANTVFGAGNGFKGKDRAYHQVLDDKRFNDTKLLRDLHERAVAQLGSSGGGNHFVEWGILSLEQDDAALGVPKGRYVALLTHSGSRGLGATIAGHYTQLAKQLCKLPPHAANLAYLSLDSEAGQAYWEAMNLAGDYASACHEVIHRKLTKAMGASVLAKVENHHNFA